MQTIDKLKVPIKKIGTHPIFFIGNKNNKVHTKCQRTGTKKTEEGTKINTLSPPYSELIKFTKPIKDMRLTSTYNLAHSAKVYS